MNELLPHLTRTQHLFLESKNQIIKKWLSYEGPNKILLLHNIDSELFSSRYASGVFDYFMGVISGETQIGNCPIMQNLLAYLKDREIGADELFEICSHFRRAMIDFTYEAGINSKESFDEISYIFDQNFRGILKYYTDTIFKKLVDARQEALRAGEAKEYFLSNMSHEIRTPLNAILGFVKLLIAENLPKKHKGYLEIILSSGENLLSIINDILDFSKLRSGEFTIEPKLFSIHAELSQTLELFLASANANNITLVSFIDPKIPKELFGDSLRIKQILSNFLSNAIKFTKDGVVSVEASCDEGMLKISVSDNGIGIDKKDLKNIFTAFTQVGNDSIKKSAGTGLGLSISHQLARHMGGNVYVDSKLGEGSKFWFEIPVEVYSNECIVFDDMKELAHHKIALYTQYGAINFKHQSFLRYAKLFGLQVNITSKLDPNANVTIFSYEDVDSSFVELVKKSDSSFIVLMGKLVSDFEGYSNIVVVPFPLYCSKIRNAFHELFYPSKETIQSINVTEQYSGHVLVAEDNEANQELIKILLGKYGLSCDIAQNGLEAYNLYREKHYDLILMDEQMPIMDGNEAVRRILAYEKENKRPHTPISAVTANVMKGSKERDLSNGFDSFLGKPIVLKELERVFTKYLPSTQKLLHTSSKAMRHEIRGLDAKKLSDELMLTQDELITLLELFIKKMHTTLKALNEAVIVGDMKKIALLSHAIKGSSGNFRIEFLQDKATEMEKMAKESNRAYDFYATFLKIKKRIEEIEIL
ncbi:MAG: response regulator [Epsilonproteobacteria bacterium]|nr:response regulator [Campylobacterota bacterium]